MDVEMKGIDPDKMDEYEFIYHDCLKKKTRTKQEQCIIDLMEAYLLARWHDRKSSEHRQQGFDAV